MKHGSTAKAKIYTFNKCPFIDLYNMCIKETNMGGVHASNDLFIADVYVAVTRLYQQSWL